MTLQDTLPWIRHQVCLKFVEVDIQCSLESQRGGDGGNYLSNKSVEIRVRGSGYLKIGSKISISNSKYANADIQTLQYHR